MAESVVRKDVSPRPGAPGTFAVERLGQEDRPVIAGQTRPVEHVDSRGIGVQVRGSNWFFEGSCFGRAGHLGTLTAPQQQAGIIAPGYNCEQPGRGHRPRPTTNAPGTGYNEHTRLSPCLSSDEFASIGPTPMLRPN